MNATEADLFGIALYWAVSSKNTKDISFIKNQKIGSVKS
ncbi:hypothetical protein PPEP_b0167 [Pseudoalteromonas peptidolytica F12-50-A1]|uniref:Uncharacterized protein n=1 Tax=Pseudoalteromonas peptidolytica F12-50-A1 TaxID=1315280 RepID=A0A8I0N0E3_9GAMM|nr:hypothetical protein [Pseudoalteromonas peptidolytica F12-50-A1]